MLIMTNDRSIVDDAAAAAAEGTTTTEQQLALVASRYHDRLAQLQQQRAKATSARQKQEQRDWVAQRLAQCDVTADHDGGQSRQLEASGCDVQSSEGSLLVNATSAVQRVTACLSNRAVAESAAALDDSMERVTAAAFGRHDNGHEKVVSELVERLRQRRAEFERAGHDSMQRLTELLRTSRDPPPSGDCSLSGCAPEGQQRATGDRLVRSVCRPPGDLGQVQTTATINEDVGNAVVQEVGRGVSTPLEVTVAVPHLLSYGLLFSTLDAVSTVLTALSVEDVMRMTARQLAHRILNAARCDVVRPAATTLSAYESNFALFSQISLSAARSALLEWDSHDVLSDMYDRGTVAVVLCGPHLCHTNVGDDHDDANNNNLNDDCRAGQPVHQGLPLRGEIPLTASPYFRRWAAVSWEASRYPMAGDEEDGRDDIIHVDRSAPSIHQRRYESLQAIRLHALVFMLRPGTADAMFFHQQFPVDLLGHPSLL